MQEPADYAWGVAQEVEELLRAQLSRVRTRDGIAGEHAGYNGQAVRQWVIAPIAELDNFRRGVPVWATLIALLDQGEPVVGCGVCTRAGPPLVGCSRFGRVHG